MKNQKMIAIMFFITMLFLFYGCDKSKSDWERTEQLNTIEAYEEFLSMHPQSKFADNARQKVEKLVWDKTLKENTIEAYQKFISKYPQSTFAENARQKIEELGIPKAFKGFWVKQDKDGKQIGNIEVTENSIIWERFGVPTETVALANITISEDKKKLAFASEVVVARNVFIPSAKIAGKTSVKLSRDAEDLIVGISGIKEKSTGGGLFSWKAGTSISYEIIDGKEVAVIKYPSEVHRYKQSK